MGLFSGKKPKELPELDLPPPPSPSTLDLPLPPKQVNNLPPLRESPQFSRGIKEQMNMNTLPPLPPLEPIPRKQEQKTKPYELPPLKFQQDTHRFETGFPTLPPLEPVGQIKGKNLDLPELPPFEEIPQRQEKEIKKTFTAGLPPFESRNEMNTKSQQNQFQTIKPEPRIQMPNLEELETLPTLDINTIPLKESPFLEEKDDLNQFKKEKPKRSIFDMDLRKPEQITHIDRPKPLSEIRLMDIEHKQIHDMGPLFVKSDDYKEIMKNISQIRGKINESDNVLINLNEIKKQKDKELEKLNSQINDIQRKLVYIDKSSIWGIKMDSQRKTPLFIRIDEYKDTLDIIHLMKQKIKLSRAILQKINELNNQEDAQLQEWKASLDEVEKRIEYIDSLTLEPETL